jgi:hypothetical protein
MITLLTARASVMSTEFTQAGVLISGLDLTVTGTIWEAVEYVHEQMHVYVHSGACVHRQNFRRHLSVQLLIVSACLLRHLNRPSFGAIAAE